MTWLERLNVPAYTSVLTETRTEWRYREAFTTDFQTRLDRRRYVGVNGVYYRRLGFDGFDYPMACVFDGPDHDLAAKAFIKTLLEEDPANPDKPGILEHPTDGVIPVMVDGGRVTRDTVNDAAETIVEVLFQKQTLPPEVQQDSPTVSTRRQFEALTDSAAADFDFMSFVDTPGGRLAAIKAATENLNVIGETMSAVARGNAEVLTQINLIQDDVLRNLDTLVKSPAILAQQMQNLVNTIAAIPGNISERVEAWADLYNKSRPATGETLTPSEDNRNIIANQELVCTAATANMFLDIAENADSFPSVLDAFNTLNDIQQQREDLEVFLAEQQTVYDTNIVQKQIFTQQETLDQMSTLAQLSGNAVRDAAPLIGTKMSVLLPRDYALLQFAYEYKGVVDDDTLQQIIDTNLLNVEEIVLLPRGRELLI